MIVLSSLLIIKLLQLVAVNKRHWQHLSTTEHSCPMDARVLVACHSQREAACMKVQGVEKGIYLERQRGALEAGVFPLQIVDQLRRGANTLSLREKLRIDAAGHHSNRLRDCSEMSTRYNCILWRTNVTSTNSV
jgi:hypothetical protein